MSTNPFGQSNSFGTPVANEPPPAAVAEIPAKNTRPMILGAIAGSAVLLAVGGYFLVPGLLGGSDDVAAGAPIAPVASTPVDEVPTDAVDELPVLTQSSGRNPFLSLVGDASGASATTDGSTGTVSGDTSAATSTDATGTGSSGSAAAAAVAGPAGPEGPAGPAGANGVNGVTPEYATVTYTGQSTTDPNAATFNVITMEGPTTVTVLPAGATNADGSTATGVLDPTGLTSASLLAYLGLDTDADSGLSYAKLQFGDSQVYRGFQDFPLSFFTPTTS